MIGGLQYVENESNIFCHSSYNQIYQGGISSSQISHWGVTFEREIVLLNCTDCLSKVIITYCQRPSYHSLCCEQEYGQIADHHITSDMVASKSSQNDGVRKTQSVKTKYRFSGECIKVLCSISKALLSQDQMFLRFFLAFLLISVGQERHEEC